MQLSNYSEEYVRDQMSDFNDFVSVVHDTYGFNAYSARTLAILYTVMKRETPRESSEYSGY